VLVFGTAAFTVALFGSLLVNYLYRWPFVSTFVYSLAALMSGAVLLVMVVSKHWELQPIHSEFVAEKSLFAPVLMGVLLLYEALLIYCAMAILFSTRLGQVMTILFTLVGGVLMSQIGAWRAAVSGPADGILERGFQLLINLIYHITPDLNFLWVADDLSSGLTVSSTYVLSVSLYSLLFIVALLSLAVALFQTREVG